MRIKSYFYRLASPLRQLYWRVLKPNTFGVRVLIIHPTDSTKILLIRHTYGNRGVWYIPGGGYKPKKEKPEAAAAREVREEAGLTLSYIKKIGMYESGGEGKHDAVTLFSATAKNPDEIKLGPEIAESSWTDSYSVLDKNNIAGVTRKAVGKFLSTK